MAAALCLRLWPWQQAAGHLILLGLVGSIFTDISLCGFHKIPFACSYLPGKSQVHMVFLSAAGLLYFVLLAVKLEQQVLLDPHSTAVMLVAFALAACAVRLWTRFVNSGPESLHFEESRDPSVLELGLHRDGVMPLGPLPPR